LRQRPRIFKIILELHETIGAMTEEMIEEMIVETKDLHESSDQLHL
jgi:hypothetical protein